MRAVRDFKNTVPGTVYNTDSPGIGPPDNAVLAGLDFGYGIQNPVSIRIHGQHFLELQIPKRQRAYADTRSLGCIGRCIVKIEIRCHVTVALRDANPVLAFADINRCHIRTIRFPPI